MKEGINASSLVTYEGLQSKVEEVLEREKKNKDLRTHNEEMRQLINDFESTAPVNNMQSLGHDHVYSKERGCQIRGHAAASFILYLLTCYLFIHYYN